ncbi:MAG TPA: HPr family phosphocarrier protein [Acidobacteriota bacterium]|nr:HPr family phosphocarrier protein [Acidobacteriota bacterium]
MKEGNIEINNERGLHARAASKFVHLASEFTSTVKLRKDGVTVDGKSILGILLLQASKGCRIHLTVDGEDEEEAFDRLSKMISGRFGEKK